MILLNVQSPPRELSIESDRPLRCAVSSMPDRNHGLLLVQA